METPKENEEIYPLTSKKDLLIKELISDGYSLFIFSQRYHIEQLFHSYDL